MSKTSCSVFGCSNSGANTKGRMPKVNFYRFPTPINDLNNRKQAWIRFCKRTNPDGSEWMPTKHSIVCSEHFVSGKKVEHPHHRDYIPTVPPNKKKATTEALTEKELNLMLDPGVARYNRIKKRQELKKLSQMPIEYKNSSTQTESQQFYGSIEKWDYERENATTVGSQVTHETLKHPPKIPTIPKPVPINMTANEIMESCKLRKTSPFGFKGLKNDEECISLTGVTLDTFKGVVDLMDGYTPHSYSKEDHLLLFLMKFKLGISFIALATIFGIHRTSARRIFTALLHRLYGRTDLIKWPSKEDIEAILPGVFDEK